MNRDLPRLAERTAAPAVWAWMWLVLGGICWTGCDRSAPETAVYPRITRGTSAPASAATNRAFASLPQGPFYIVQSSLSPATLVHGESPQFTLFSMPPESGLGAPQYFACSSRSGPRSVTNGQQFAAAELEENWLVAWFAGAPGWTNWDCPWLVVLQHRPKSVRLDTNGLHLEFAERAGDVLLMPFFGLAPSPVKGQAVPGGADSAAAKAQTWKWPEVITRDVLARARYWASTLREFPIGSEEQIRLDSGAGTVVVHQRFSWHTVQDDWKSRRQKLAPIPSILAHAMRLGFPAVPDGQALDMDLPTACGSYRGIERVDQYEVALPVLKFVNTDWTAAPGATDAALDRLRRALAEQLGLATTAVSNGAPGAASVGPELAFLAARALPMLEPGQAASVRELVRRTLLAGKGQTGGSEWLPAWWAYAHFANDWDLAREHWNALKQAVPEIGDWACLCAEEKTNLVRQAASLAAAARLAYRLGDGAAYDMACERFARCLPAAHARFPEATSGLFTTANPEPILQLVTASVPQGAATASFVGPFTELRTNQTARPLLLIPGDTTSGFVVAQGAAGSRCIAGLTHTVQWQPPAPGTPRPAWPEVTWAASNIVHGNRWTFGMIRLGTNAPTAAREQWINGTTRAVVFETR